MGLTAAEWNQVSAAGLELLGDGWVRLGKGRKLKVWRVPVGWWAQYVYHEDSSSGRFVAWGSLLAKPMASAEMGDSGHSLASIRSLISNDAERRRYLTMTDAHDPVALASFADFAEENKFSQDRDLDARARSSESRFRGWQERGQRHPYYGNTRQLLVMLRVMSGSRPLSELIDDVRWVLDEDNYASGNSKSAAFYPELLTTLDGADRPAMEALLQRMRRENLAELGVPDEYVSEVSVPEPEVPW